MMPAQKERPRPSANREATGAKQSSTAILDICGRSGKQVDWGHCAGCGARIDPPQWRIWCRQCEAWHRWYRAHLLAHQALQEAAR